MQLTQLHSVTLTRTACYSLGLHVLKLYQESHFLLFWVLGFFLCTFAGLTLCSFLLQQLGTKASGIMSQDFLIGSLNEDGPH